MPTQKGMDKVQVIVIGAGAIGSAITRALSLRGVQCLLLEQHKQCGMETSSRSSEVLHAGLYYGMDTLKTKLCIEGREKLSKYMIERSIPHNPCSKLIVATQDADLVKLHQLHDNGLRNGLSRLELWDSHRVAMEEASIIAKQALYSPYTAVFSTHSVLQNYLLDIEQAGSMVVTNCSFISAKAQARAEDGFVVETSQGPIQSTWLINTAGLWAHAVARCIIPLPKAIPDAYYGKGSYFKLAGSTQPFQRLIYPLPQIGGLGVHATLDLQGGVRFGPDVEWVTGPVDQLDFKVSADKDAYVRSIEQFWPAICDHDLVPDYAGIRPKISKEFADFLIQDEAAHGVQRLIQLFGMESPGWTASMAVGDLVADKVVKG